MTTTTALPTNVGGTLLAPAPTTPAARRRWLAARRAGLGASEVSTILGLAPNSWGTSPLGVWLEKVHPEAAPVVPTERMLWGLRLERPIADEYRVRHAKPAGLRVDPCPGLLAHPRHPWLLATPDRVVTRPIGTTARLAVGVLEIKCADQMLVREWDDGVPLHYQVQVQVQMGITGLPWADVVPLFGGNYMPTPHRVEFDQTVFDQIIEICEPWWTRHVVYGEPPDPELTDLELLPQVWPGDDSVAQLGEGLLARLEVRERIKERIKALGQAAARVEVDLKVHMKNSRTAWAGDRKVATWSRFPTKQFRLDDFRTDHPTLAAEYTTTKPGQRLTVHKPPTEGKTR